MTSPRHAAATSRGRYYTHPVTRQQLVSVTNVLGQSMAKPALVPWAAKMTAEAAWDALPRMVAALRRPTDCRPTRAPADFTPCGRCAPCLSREIKGAHKVAGEKASDLGTRIHAQADAHATGRPMLDDPEAAPYVEQYLRFLADYEINIDRHVYAAELTVAHPDLGYAGTLDLIVRLPFDGIFDGQVRPTDRKPHPLHIVDIKTSATRTADSIYDEYALQLTALRRCKEMWLPDDTVVPMVRGIVGTAVLNLRRTSYALIPVPSGEPERKAWEGALASAKWRHTDPIGACRPVTPDGKPIPKRTRTAAAPKAVTPGKVA